LTEQNVNVTQVVQNQGCMSGCFTLFAVLAVIGLAVEYWYPYPWASWSSLPWPGGSIGDSSKSCNQRPTGLRLPGQICGDWSNASKKLPRGAARYEKLASHDPAKS
jgi:hypothetical protein